MRLTVIALNFGEPITERGVQEHMRAFELITGVFQQGDNVTLVERGHAGKQRRGMTDRETKTSNRGEQLHALSEQITPASRDR